MTTTISQNSSERWRTTGTPVTLTPGTVFDTPFEDGCTVTTSPGLDSFAPKNFLATDSDDVECEFSTVMVVGHPDYIATIS